MIEFLPLLADQQRKPASPTTYQDINMWEQGFLPWEELHDKTPKNFSWCKIESDIYHFVDSHGQERHNPLPPPSQ